MMSSDESAEPPPTPAAPGGMSEMDAALCVAVDRAFESEQLPFLRRLVDQPSYSEAKDDVEAAARMVDAQAEAIGLRLERVPDPRDRYADHRVYYTPNVSSGDRCVGLVGHVDTVFPRRMGFLTMSRDDGPAGPGTGDVIRGPGVLDMKSGLSCILFALRALRQTEPTRWARLRGCVICNTDEEVGSPSSAPLFESLAPRLSTALVFEAGREGDRIITRRKGSASVQLIVRGRAAHAGLHHAEGVNAIAVLARLVLKVEALTDPRREVTVNVGLIEGGTAKNTVPDEARCTIDCRFTSQVDAKRLMEQIDALVADPFGDDADVTPRLREAVVTRQGGIVRPPMEVLDGTEALRRGYQRHAHAVGLAGGEAPLQGGGSDANLLVAHGVPCIDGLGPAGGFFHHPDEWSCISSLRRRTQALACFLAEQAGGTGA